VPCTATLKTLSALTSPLRSNVWATSPHQRILTDNHADASSRGHLPGCYHLRIRHQRRKLGAVVSSETTVGEAQPLFPWRLRRVGEVGTQSVTLHGARLGFHLEEPTLLGVFGLNLHVLPVTVRSNTTPSFRGQE
jgi:hypothetical protein